MHPPRREKGEGDLLWKLWNKEVKESIQTKGLAKNSQGVKESAGLPGIQQRERWRRERLVVNVRLNTKEGEGDLYQLARQKD